MDTLFVIQVIAVVLFAACFFYAWRSEGQRYAQQWFLIGYIFAILIISLLVIVGQERGQIAYHPDLIVLGAAPSLLVMIYPALFYISYILAKRMVDATNLRLMAYLIFIITPWLMLPLDLFALNSGWWSFPSESFSFLGGVPFYIPFAWGITAASFFVMVGRIRKIRLRGNGQFYAMILATPLLVGVDFIFIALIQVSINTLAVIGGEFLRYAALAILFLLLPLALFLNIPRIAGRDSRAANGKS